MHRPGRGKTLVFFSAGLAYEKSWTQKMDNGMRGHRKTATPLSREGLRAPRPTPGSSRPAGQRRPNFRFEL